MGVGGRCRLGGRALRRSRKKKPDAGDEARGKPAVGWRLASGARWSGSLLQGGSGTEYYSVPRVSISGVIYILLAEVEPSSQPLDMISCHAIHSYTMYIF